ncbi:T9SS type A sorting domain-containing protein [Crocinitomix catalasitica]|uniref:T9SS type A sorting domain-containing protein n=1 Tax=Crocinitomix catalasitica TaxID=184607 RepID=UPI000686C84C|nr:T9SS type A sorting domain-containing protein [Crocinitomix catalasitica]
MKVFLTYLGLFLSLVTFAQGGPGGIGDINTSNSVILWLRAGEGKSTEADGSNLQLWNDLTSSSHNATQGSVSKRPIFRDNASDNVNTFSAVEFDGTNDQLTISNHNDINLDSDGYEDRVIYMVLKTGANVSDQQLIYEEGGKSNGFVFEIDNDNLYLSSHVASGRQHEYFSTPISSDEVIVASYFFENSADHSEGFVNGVSIGSSGAANKMPRHSGAIAFGGINGRTVFHDDAVGTGSSASTDAQSWEGDMFEYVAFDYIPNTAQKIIIDNYFAAKYGLTTPHDIYNQDDAINGQFDYDVAGIGQASDGSNQLDSKGTGIVRVDGATDLDNDEFFIWGHDNDVLGAYHSSDFPPSLEGRWHRLWRVTEMNQSLSSAVDVGAVNVSFDLAGIGAVASDLRLLVDTDNDGLFADETPIAGAVDLGHEIFEFPGVTEIGNNMRFTLGTIDIIGTPLPIELVNFNCQPTKDMHVLMDWETKSELNNDYFILEKSLDLMNWEQITQIDGQGNTSSATNYSHVDRSPFLGLSYYRIVSVDFEGVKEIEKVQAVNLAMDDLIQVYPLPAHSGTINVQLKNEIQSGVMNLVNMRGQVIQSTSFNSDQNIQLEFNGTAGIYFLEVIVNQVVIDRKKIIYAQF